METAQSPYLKHLYVCVNQRDPGVTCCSHGGGDAIQEKLKAFVKENGLKGKVRVSKSGCMDLCAKGPNVMVYPEHRWYRGVSLADVDEIIQKELAPLMEAKSVQAAHPELVEGERLRPSTGSGRTESPIRAFLFDLGNVIVQFDHRLCASEIASHSKVETEELYRLFFESDLVVDHDRGKISTEQFYAGIRSKIGLSLSYEKFLEVWNNIFTENEETAKILRQLLPSYPCFLISNTNRPHFEFLRKRYPILSELNGWVLSYEVGELKPHPKIYQQALGLAQVPASHIFYVDDREDLIAAGLKLGLQAHWFQGADHLQKELSSRGILNGR